MANNETFNFKFAALDNNASQRNINRIANIGKVTKKLAHETAVGILMHKLAHGDHTKMIGLVDAIKSAMGSSQSKAFIQWVANYTNLEYVPEATAGKGKDKVVTPHSFKTNKARKDQLEEGQAKPFWELEIQTPQAPIDIQAIVLGALQRAASGKLKEGQEDFFKKLVEVTGFEPKREATAEEKLSSKEDKQIAKIMAARAARLEGEKANA